MKENNQSKSVIGLMLFVIYTLIFLSIFIGKDLFGQPYSYDWAKHIVSGVNGSDFGKSIVIDSKGNSCNVGVFNGTADFDPGVAVYNLTGSSTSNGYVQKLDVNGNLLWAAKFDGYSPCIGITVDVSDNIYVVGEYSGTIDFDPGIGVVSLTSPVANGYIVKLDATGNFLWVKDIGARGENIRINSSSEIIISGRLNGTRDFDPGAGIYNLSSNGGNDVYVLKLDALGNFMWVKSLGSTGFDICSSIDLTTTDDILMIGDYQGIVDFDPGPGIASLSSSGTFDIYILKLDVNGNFLWVKSSPGATAEMSKNLAQDAVGNIYLTGYFTGTVDFDPGVSIYNLTASFFDIYVLKLDPSGNFLWANKIGGSGIDVSNAITITPSGYVIIGGYYQNTVDFDPGIGIDNYTVIDNIDAYVHFMDLNGNYEGTLPIEGLSGEQVISIASDQFGNVYVLGNFRDWTDFDYPGTAILNSTNGYDAFLLKLKTATPLPVELVSFDAERSGDRVKTYWKTASEINNDYFTVLRSKDAVNYEEIAQVAGIGNSNIVLNYEFYDAHPYNGLNYYQLKQTDFDGTTSYSKIAAVHYNQQDQISIYPNPAKDFFTVSLNTLTNNQFVVLKLYNGLGQEVYSKREMVNEDTNHLKVETSSLLAGVYTLKTNVSSNSVYRIVIQ